MLELDSRGLPFASPNKIIYETRHRLIASIEPNSVIKVSKEGSDRSIFPTVEGALAEINENEASRIKIACLLNSIGANSNMVVPTQTVIHLVPSGSGLTYTEVQTWHKSTTPVAGLGRKLFSLPSQTIKDLKSLFQVNQTLLKSEKTCFEFDGSCGPKAPNVAEKVLHNLFPLLYAHNVLIDPLGLPLLVDVESLDKFAKFTRYGIKGWARRQIKTVGFNLSIGILNSLLFMRESGLQR